MPVYKDKDSGNWYASFYYTDWTGKNRKKKKGGFKKRSEAKDFETSFLNRQITSCEIPFDALVSLYLEDMSNRLKKSTIEKKKNIIDTKILPYFDNVPINTIKATHIRQWQNAILAGNYKPTYVKCIHTQLSAIFNYAVKYYDLHENPCRKAGSIGKNHAETMYFWTLEEFKAFISHLTDPAAIAAFTLFFYSGMRRGELFALTPDCFDFEKCTVSISKTLTRLNGEDFVSEPKTAKSKRIIVLPEAVAQHIENYIQLLYGIKTTDRIFPYTRSFLEKQMKLGCAASGVKRIRIHDLRHSHASLLIEMGTDILLLSERLGHDKIETTLNTYGHLYPNKHEDVAKQLNQFIVLM